MVQSSNVTTLYVFGPFNLADARLAPNIISFFYANTSNLTEPNHGAKERDKGRVVSGKTICTQPTHVCSCCGADAFCARPAVVIFSCQIILHNSLPKFTVTRNEKSIFNPSLLSVTYSASLIIYMHEANLLFFKVLNLRL